ncbi:MAG: HDOD domain-containing protein [Treponema sp.]|nr:HDOD domain-containing protein [Treponema sp.]
MAENVSKKIGDYIVNMPSLPTSVAKVLEVCNNPQTSPADLNHVISLDPVLVARVLKLINSAYYGLGQQVTSLVRAIIMIGINTVKNLALSTSVVGNLSKSKNPSGLDIEGFWRHSLCVGVAAKAIAKKRGVDNKQWEEYFAAGLLHDIGKIPLNAVLQNDYMLIVSSSDRDKLSLVRSEDRDLGINHCNSGALIVKAWKLEGSVGDVIVFHHNHTDYDGEHRDLLYTIILANYFALQTETGFSGDLHPEKPGPSIWEALGITPDVFDEISEKVNVEIEKAEVFLKL